MKKYKIPQTNTDLRRYATLKQTWRIVGFVIYCAVIALAYLFYLGGALRKPLEPIFLVIFIFAVIISGAFIFRTDRFLSDKNLSGRIESIKVKRNYGRGMTRNAKLSLDFHTYNKIKITDGKGKHHTLTVQLFDDGFDGYYSEGDEIIAFRGLNYPLSLEAERRGEHLCSVCGARCYDKEKREGSLISNGTSCPACSKTMINTEELTK